MTKAQYDLLRSAETEGTFGGIAVTADYWPDGVVPFDFVTSGTGAVSVGNQIAAMNAMIAVGAVAGVVFRSATINDSNLIRFQNSNFNNSPVGMQVGAGAQIINIHDWNSQFRIVHEIYHSLGFWHEQSRIDRNTYVTINWNDICGSGVTTQCDPDQCQLCADASGFISCAHNFDRKITSSNYGPYDFDSVMHYSATAFSCTGLDTITINPPYTGTIGQRTHISYYDGITCRGIYPFAGDRWLDQDNLLGIQSGTFFEPWATALTQSPTFMDLVNLVPTAGTLFIKSPAVLSAVGTYTNAITIAAPVGGVVLGD